MVKIKNINQISDHFEEVVKDSIKQTYADWLKNHYSKLWHLQSILDELKVYLPTNGNGNNLPEELWQEVKNKVIKITSWAESIKYTSDDLSLKSLSNTWQKGFNDVQYSLPEIIKLEIRPSLLQVQSEDKNGFKLRKNIYGALKNLPFNIHGSKTNIRKIELHNFLTHYLEVPVTNAILNLWQQYLTEISEQYHDLFEKISELKEKVLFIEDLKNLQDPFEKNDYFEKIFTIAEILNQTDIVLQSMQERENQIDKFIDDEWKVISDIIEFCWQYAGTFILPNKKYRDELLSYNKKIAEKNFKKFANYWKEHFMGIRANWLKNLEIFILQLNVIEEFRKSSKNMIINNEVILNPAFENILSSIEKEENKYLSKFTSNGFKQRIRSTQSEFFKNFKNQTMPQLIDSIYQTQITELLESFISEIEAVNDNATETHKIVKFHKNGSLPPKSKTHNIDFQLLIKNEIINPQSTQFYEQIKEAKNRLKSIIRSLTEINHLYELNWDSANNLIKDNNGNGEFEEALSIIKITLKRSREIINKSREDSKEALMFSAEILVNKSQELYRGYQSLTNTDQLVEYHLKLRRDKSQIHLTKVLKKIYGFLKFVFTDSIKILVLKLKSLVLNKKVDSGGTIEEILAEHSKQIKLDLSKIPTIYQRLFTAMPERDNRFYLERKNETEQIVKSFQKWEEGKNVLTVLLGDRGSGKTSILNFAEKNVFQSRNVVRINLESCHVDEKELLSILKKSFNLKNVKTWEKLQEKITQDTNSQIVILDNLHYLYLKTPNGFEVFERFLMFLQQTRHDVYWLFSCSDYSWVFLDKVINISQHINFPIYLENFSADELKNIILERHKISGHEIVFKANEDELQSRQHKKLIIENKLHNYLRDKIFNKLQEISQGNITIAFLYWLTSIKEFTNNKVFLNPILPIKQTLFEQLENNDLFTLVPFVHQQNLKSNEISTVMRTLNHQNILSLNRLHSFGLLEIKDEYFRLNMNYYAQIKNTLLSKRYLQKNGNDTSGKPENKVTFDLYLPVKTDTLPARKIAFQSTAISKYIDLSKNVAVNFVNKIYDGVSVYNMQIESAIINLEYKELFVSEVTEMILSEMLKQSIVSQEDFYN